MLLLSWNVARVAETSESDMSRQSSINKYYHSLFDIDHIYSVQKNPLKLELEEVPRVWIHIIYHAHSHVQPLAIINTLSVRLVG